MKTFLNIGLAGLMAAGMLMASCGGSDNVITPDAPGADSGILDTKGGLHFSLSGVDADWGMSGADVWYRTGGEARMAGLVFDSKAGMWSLDQDVAAGSEATVVWPKQGIKDGIVTVLTENQDDVLAGRAADGIRDGSSVAMSHLMSLVRFSFEDDGYSGEGSMGYVVIDELSSRIRYDVSTGMVEAEDDETKLMMMGYGLRESNSGSFVMPAGSWDAGQGKPWIFEQGTNSNDFSFGTVIGEQNGFHIYLVDRIPTIQFQIDGYWFLCRLEGVYDAGKVYDVKLKVSGKDDGGGKTVPSVALDGGVGVSDWTWYGKKH